MKVYVGLTQEGRPAPPAPTSLTTAPIKGLIFPSELEGVTPTPGPALFVQSDCLGVGEDQQLCHPVPPCPVGLTVSAAVLVSPEANPLGILAV